MNKILIIACVLLFSGTLLAQDSKIKADPKSFISLHGGPSFPVGAFGSTDMADSANAGFAKTGYNIQLNYGYLFQKNWGVVANVFYTDQVW